MAAATRERITAAFILRGGCAIQRQVVELGDELKI
jgi:hypothetical protein